MNHFLLKSTLKLSLNWSCCLTYEYFKKIFYLSSFLFKGDVLESTGLLAGSSEDLSINCSPISGKKSIYTHVFTFCAFLAFPCLLFTKKVLSWHILQKLYHNHMLAMLHYRLQIRDTSTDKVSFDALDVQSKSPPPSIL